MNIKEYAELLDYINIKASEANIVNVSFEYNPQNGKIWKVILAVVTENYYIKTNHDTFNQPEVVGISFVDDNCTLENVKIYIDSLCKDKEW